MNKYLLIFILLTFCVLLMAQAENYRIIDTKTGKIVTLDKMVAGIQKYDVIFFGEFHDDAILHQMEAEILPLMYQKNPKMAISMEMFEKDNQLALNSYLSGTDTEEEMKKNVRLWPNHETDYKPIIAFAKSHTLPVIAANIPRRYASMVAKSGITALESLPVAEKTWIMRKPVILDDEYRIKFMATMQDAMGSGKGMPGGNQFLDNIYAAQCIKDDTMAESMNDYLVQNPGTSMIHYNGDFHSAAHLGTAQKLALLNPKLRIAVITPIAFQPNEELSYQKIWQKEGDFLVLIHRNPAQDDNNNSMPIAEPIISHNISIELFSDIHFMKGSDQIRYSRNITEEDSLLLSPYLKISSIKQNDKEVKYILQKNEEGYQSFHLLKDSNSSEITVFYEGVLYNYADLTAEASQWGLISEQEKEGIYLPVGAWYPTPGHGLANYKVSAICKFPTRLVCSGKEEIKISADNHYNYIWTSEYPYEGVTLFGGKFTIKSLQVGDMRLSVYLKTPDTKNAPKFLTQMQTYYVDYTNLFGKYPGSSMNLIENFLPEGMSYPDMYIFPSNLFQASDILLSSTVLGHEMSRSWWGNAIYAKSSEGNWTDILNNFISNYYWLEMHGKSGETDLWRKNALQDINFLSPQYHYPLENFYFAEKKNDAVIGFQKGGMVFYNLYDQMGKKDFFAGLKDFIAKYQGKYAGWTDLLRSLQSQNPHDKNQDLTKVAEQWLSRPDFPSLSLADVKHSGKSIDFVLKQTSPPFMLHVPIAVNYATGSDTIYVDTVNMDQQIHLALKGNIESLEIDPGYKVIRKLSGKDMVFCLKRTFQENPLIVLPESGSKMAEIGNITNMFKQNGIQFDTVLASKIDTVDWQNRSLLVFGSVPTNSFFNRFLNKLPSGFTILQGSIQVPSRTFSGPNSSLIFSFMSPFNSEHSLSFWLWNTETAVKSMRIMFKYVDHSWQAFDNDIDPKNLLLQGDFVQNDAYPMKWVKP